MLAYACLKIEKPITHFGSRYSYFQFFVHTKMCIWTRPGCNRISISVVCCSLCIYSLYLDTFFCMPKNTLSSLGVCIIKNIWLQRNLECFWERCQNKSVFGWFCWCQRPINIRWEANSLDWINITKNRLEFDRKNFTQTNVNIGTWPKLLTNKH